MDINMLNLINKMKVIGSLAKSIAEDYEKYYAGFNADIKWKAIENELPNDDETVLVSWWDQSKRVFNSPIRAYWHEENEHFYALDSIQNIPIQVEIWCRLLDMPQEKL